MVDQGLHATGFAREGSLSFLMDNGPWVLIVLLSRNPEKGRPPISAQAKCNRGHNNANDNAPEKYHT